MLGKIVCWMICKCGGGHDWDRPLGTWMRACRRCGHRHLNFLAIVGRSVSPDGPA